MKTDKELRKEKKKIEKRKISGEEVIFIFEKVLEEWKTIRIYNLENPTPKPNFKSFPTEIQIYL